MHTAAHIWVKPTQPRHQLLLERAACGLLPSEGYADAGRLPYPATCWLVSWLVSYDVTAAA